MKFTAVILSALLCLPLWAEQNEEKSDEALVAAAEQLVAEANAAKLSNTSEIAPESVVGISTATSVESAKPEAELKESEIPVVISEKKEAKAESNMIWRMVASIAVIAVVAGVGMFATRRWRVQKDKGGNKARIEIMHQLHMGPKKSLALIRVSGEAMLIGITDHNVNMLKSVTLIDDELESAVTKDFNNFLEDEFSIEDVRNALNPRV